MEGIVLDMDGYSFKGCVSVVADIANKGQTTRCNLQFKGSNFAILNGNFSKSIAGGYVFQINPDSTDPENYTNIVLDGLASGDGGIDIRGSSVTLRNCNFNQPVGNTQNFTTLMFTDSYVTIESGTYRNKSNYSYKRWLKLFNSKAYVKAPQYPEHEQQIEDDETRRDHQQAPYHRVVERCRGRIDEKDRHRDAEYRRNDPGHIHIQEDEDQYHGRADQHQGPFRPQRPQ